MSLRQVGPRRPGSLELQERRALSLGAAERAVWEYLGWVLPIAGHSTQDRAVPWPAGSRAGTPAALMATRPVSSTQHPLVPKGISHLQHSLSTSSKEPAVPNTRVSLALLPRVLL